MPLWMMSALMLLISALFGTVRKCLESRGLTKAGLLVFLCAILLVSREDLVFIPELTLNPGAILCFVAACVLLVRSRLAVGSALTAAAFSALLAVFITAVSNRLSPDAAVLLSAVVSVPAFLYFKGYVPVFFICSLAPVFSAVLQMLIAHHTLNYAFFELDSRSLDLQLTGILFNTFIIELLGKRKMLSAQG